MTKSATAVRQAPEAQYADAERMLNDLAEMACDSVAYRVLRDRIIRRCLPIADNIARRYHGRGESHEDLQQVARVGLVKAVSRFDPAMGAPLLSYAVPTIMGEVRRHFRDHGWSMRVPRRLKDLHTQISRTSPDLAQRLHRSPTATEIADELGVDRQEIIEALVAGGAYAPRSIDAPTRGDDPGTATIASSLGTLDRQLASVDDRESLRPLILALPDRERTILEMRFFNGMTQTQIAAAIGTSQMQVSRLLAKTLEYLRFQLLNC